MAQKQPKKENLPVKVVSELKLNRTKPPPDKIEEVRKSL